MQGSSPEKNSSNAYGDTVVTEHAFALQGNNYGTVNIHKVSVAPTRTKGDILHQSLLFDFWNARLRNVTAALNETCQWVFLHETFQSWLSPNLGLRNGGFLWLRGKPGSGKSTIMKKTIAWSENHKPGHTILSYFFNARSPDELEKSSLGLYRSLTYQLLAAHPEAFVQFELMFSSKIRNDKMIEEWTVSELHNFWLDFVRTSKLVSLLLFIDALDEGAEDDVRSMIDGLVDVVQQRQTGHHTVRVCLSSRHYPGITIEESLSIVVERQAGHASDMDLYIKRKLKGKPDLPLSDLRMRILARSQAVFLWVVLVVSMLNKLYDQGHSIKSRVKCLEEVPGDLHDLFSRVITRESHSDVDKDHPHDDKQQLRLFRWVLYSLRPLPLCDIHAAVQIVPASERSDNLSSPSDDDETQDIHEAKRRILHLSRGLVEITQPWLPVQDDEMDENSLWNNQVQFIHETARDFLLGKSHVRRVTADTISSQEFIVNFQADLCHAALAEDCLTYLTTITTEDDLTEGQIGLLTYAARYWWQHVNAIEGEISESIISLATKLCICEDKLVIWIQNTDEKGLNTAFLHPPLYYAAWTGIADLVRNICDREGDRSGQYDCATRAASANSDGTTVPELQETTVNTLSEAWHYSNALRLASTRGHTKVVQVLITFDNNLSPPIPGYSDALHAAAKQGHVGVMQALLAAGADINTENLSSTPLQAASAKGLESVVETLLEAGADINRRSSLGSALELAIKNGHDKIVMLLLDNAACMSDRAVEMATGNSRQRVKQMLLEVPPERQCRDRRNHCRV